MNKLTKRIQAKKQHTHSIHKKSGSKLMKETLNRMKKATKTPKDVIGYNVLMTKLNRKNQPKRAIDLYKQMLNKHIQPSKYIYTTVINSHIINNTPKEGINFFYDVVMNDDQIVLDRKIYTVTIKAFLLADNPSQAIDLYYEMIDYNIIPDLNTIRLIMDSYCSLYLYQDAIDVFEIDRNSFFIEADIRAYHRLIQIYTYIEYKDPTIFLTLLENIEQDGYDLDSQCFFIVLKHLYEINDIEQFDLVWNKMIDQYDIKISERFKYLTNTIYEKIKRSSIPICYEYDMHGTCKNGKKCKFQHRFKHLWNNKK